MKVKRNQLQEGCIIASDLFLQTNQPFMKKNTVLTAELLEMINRFLVDVVEVENKLVTGERFTPKEIIDEESEPVLEKEDPFIDMYLSAVQTYKKYFQGWQSGLTVDIAQLRKMYLPLLEKAMDHQGDVLKLHHYSTKENYLYHHAVFVGVLSALIAKSLHFSKAEWIQVGIAGLMSDAGMSKLPHQLITKNGPLLQAEYEEVKKHPINSYKMLKGLKGVTDAVLLAVLQHHEREDGSGYPMRVQAEKIHAFSQIVAVADVYHAMVSERYYRTKQSPFKVIEELNQEQFGKFQPSVIQALTKELLRHLVGITARLNNGELGEVIFMNQQHLTRPMVKLNNSEDIINLSTQSSLYIADILN
ncbi:HD-GYP domain-containing protein [Alkalihalobacterium chitinilyticum]|uniref:HD-GYP domain-containing protein n=1 Tax=Alkalihalobacterium chitinilyticum TaxID=2980103 RepID=A0ABT5VFE2_9BACI|nr:HD-GYP domain-containing protein [Alkalihalobacterium chitinilyticum]MDE5414171.1 HD-GYP domain-containing protein [Alkalihalobacterium chitinilyticum]